MKKNVPKVSIVTITYNHEKYIREALDSFMMQKTDFDFEVIIADDASQDGTSKIIEEFQRRYPLIIKPILRKQNIGAQSNSIDALQSATGKYIALCEGDDYWTDSYKLQTQVDFLDTHPKYVGCFHVAQVVYEDILDKTEIYPDVTDEAWYTTEELLKINYIPTNTVMYRRQDYSDLPVNVMPLDWYIHLYHAHFGDIKFINKTMSVYRKHAAGLWWEYDRNRDKIWQRYGLSYMAFYNALLPLYDNNKGLQEIINESIITMLSRLIKIDKKYDSRLLDEALREFPENAEPFIAAQCHHLEENRQIIESAKVQLLNMGEEKEKLVREVDGLHHQIHKLGQELIDIRQSRMWRIRTRAVTLMEQVRGKNKR
jgi:glycosyltransferase involved in cell wall biosynthesis